MAFFGFSFGMTLRLNFISKHCSLSEICLQPKAPIMQLSFILYLANSREKSLLARSAQFSAAADHRRIVASVMLLRLPVAGCLVFHGVMRVKDALRS